MKNIFAIYKPKGPTSHDIINKVRKITGVKKVGHAGTLDPLASGVLVIGVGREATKNLGNIVKKEKEYMATIKLGVTSVTDDEEGEKTAISYKSPVTSDKIRKILQTFIGKISQIPPIYSAIKIKGKPAHRRVRQGEDVKLEAREVEIKKIEIVEYRWPILELKVVTGPGVYIRSLARDIGEQLGVGGYLAELERTRVGEYTKEDAIKIEDLSIEKIA
jgi:tRNA pseudouridine55 synthase